TTHGLLNIGPFTLLWTTALVGLAQGVFGAIIGAGFGAAVSSRPPARLALPVLGLVGAGVTHYLYLELARGSSLTGSGSLLRAWVALLVPVGLVAITMIASLARERRAISGELAEEAKGGVVTEDELARLKSASAR